MIDYEDRTLFYGQVFGHLLLTEGITFDTWSRFDGIVDVNIYSDFLVEKNIQLAVNEDDWNGGPSEAVRCALLDAWRAGHIHFKPECNVEAIMVQHIIDIRDRTLDHFRNSISREWYKQDIQKILSVYDRVIKKTEGIEKTVSIVEAVYEIVAKFEGDGSENHMYIHITEKGGSLYIPADDSGFQIFDGGVYSDDDPNSELLLSYMRDLCCWRGYYAIDVKQRLTEEATKKFLATIDDETMSEKTELTCHCDDSSESVK